MSAEDFEWPRALVATLRHSTLPWFEDLPAVNVAEVAVLGTRDRLSLVAQFAAHQSLLQFAGLSDCDVDPSHWSVVQKRGSDCRLVRVGARSCDPSEAPPILTLAQQFAELVRAPQLDVLRQSWARPESIFIETFRRLREDAAADLRWTRQSAAGKVLSPGPEALTAIQSEAGIHRYRDSSCVDAIRALAGMSESLDVVEIGGSPLHRYGALTVLEKRIPGMAEMSVSAVAEALVALPDQGHTIFVVLDDRSLDAASREVVSIASTAGNAAWVLPGTGEALSPTRTFVVAPTLAARQSAETRFQHAPEHHLDEFLSSDALPRFLASGQLPPAPSTSAVEEPRRSFVCALALLGTRIDADTARQYLREFLFDQDLEHLIVPGITSMEGDQFVFASDAERDAMVSLIPAASRPSLAQIAARFVEGAERAFLLLDAGESSAAIRELESLVEPDPARLLALLSRLPRALVASSPALLRRFAKASLACGHYRDARDRAALLDDGDRELLMARAERRMGDYVSALARVEKIASSSFAVQFLHGELLYQLDRYDEAKTVFEACQPATQKERDLVNCHRAVLAIEMGTTLEVTLTDPYLQSRLATYRALHAQDWPLTRERALRAISLARSVADRVDAVLDHIFALFSAGRWNEARAEAVAALALVEETQGDRAAGGILYTLAYLAADDGQFVHAAQRIAQLRHFYTTTNDDRRVREIDLLSAHLAFCRGRFGEARQTAAGVLDLHLSSSIREAAALIIDEIDWIRGVKAGLRSRGNAGNAELRDRHLLMKVRRGLGDEPLSEFANALANWERKPDGEPPRTTRRSELLKLFRSALAAGRYDVATEIAESFDLTIERHEETTVSVSTELSVFQALASAPFPLPAKSLGDVAWRFAVQNRLGHWIESGSLPPLAGEELDHIADDPPQDWLPCSDRELLYIEGVHRWSAQSRDAIAALFRTRVENERLRRLVEPDDAPTPVAALDGIIGSSAPMREVQALITRVARRDVPVCIFGESGTGKELLARSVHRLSSRRTKPFTPVNCAALPESLLESELFGHARGAFTGADRDRAGVIESTDGGTLFLDEIGEMSLSAQAKLLRFLQDGEFRRLGEAANRSADVRVVAATNRHLERAVEEGRFREDLYYRIRGIEVTLPPLRDRVTDIPMLTQHFITAEREKHRGGPAVASQDVLLVFSAYRWPGNVRELQNTIRAAHAIAGEARQIALDHLPERLRGVAVTRPARGGSYHDAVSKFRRELIEKSLLQANGNQNRAAALLNISRQALAYQIRELGIMVGKSPRRSSM